MRTLSEIQAAICELSAEDRAMLRERLDELEASAWDRQFGADVTAGRLEVLAEEALRDSREGRCRALPESK